MSVVFYVVIDIIALYFMWMAEKNTSTQEKYRLQNMIQIQDIRLRHVRLYKIYIVFSFAVLFLVSALRDNVGSDYSGYVRTFLRITNETASVSEKNRVGLGYILLCQLIGFFDKENYILMFAIIAFLTLFCFYKYIIDNGSDWVFSLYLFICFCLYYQTFNQFRQMLAMGIAYYGIKYLRKNETIKYICIVLIASSFHSSVLVLLGLVIVKNWEISKKTVSLYILICGAGFLGYGIIEKILAYTNYGSIYLGWSKYNTSFEMSSILNLGVRLVMVIGCLIFAKETIIRSPYTKVYYHAVIICTIFQILTLKSYLFGRVTTYFFGFYILLIPEVLRTLDLYVSKSSRKWIRLLIILILLMYHFVYYYSDNGAYGSGYYVYKSLLF